MPKKKILAVPKPPKAYKAKNNGITNALQYEVHPHLGWLTTASIALSSFFIMVTVIAQEGMAPPPGGMMQPPSGGFQQPGLMPPQGGTQQYPSGDNFGQPGMMQPPSGNFQQPGGMMQPPGGNYQQPENFQQPQGNFQQPGMMGSGQNNNSGQGTGQGMGQGNEGFDQNQGPSEDQQQKMDEQRLNMMKKGMSQFTKEMSRVKSQVAAYKKKGVVIPSELSDALAKADEVVAKIKDATDPDELQDVMSDFQDSMEVMQEWMQKLPRMAQWPSLLKQAQSQLTKLEKAYTADAKKITASKIDLATNLSEFRIAIDEQKALLDEAKSLKDSNFDSAFDKLTQEFFDNLNNTWENEKMIQTVLNLKRSIVTDIPKSLKSASTMITSLKRKKIDTTELQSILNEAKTLFEQVKTLYNAKPMDVDSLLEALDIMTTKREEFNDKVEELTGQNDYLTPSQMPAQGYQMNIPQGFMMPQQDQQGNMQGGQGSQTCNINGVEMPGPCSNYTGQTGTRATNPSGTGL